MNRFIKSSLLVGALLSTIGATFTAPAQADNRSNYLNNLAVQMYANNVAHGMSPLTGGIYSPYVNGAIYGNNNGYRRHRHHDDDDYNYNNGYNGYYNSNYGYGPYGYGTPYYGRRPGFFSQLINGYGY
ncbi:MAG TPA: hypothetical protein V6C89_19730 [Drouetiella sp.]|jgi:hypothetical protein